MYRQTQTVVNIQMYTHQHCLQEPLECTVEVKEQCLLCRYTCTCVKLQNQTNRINVHVQYPSCTCNNHYWIVSSQMNNQSEATV